MKLAEYRKKRHFNRTPEPEPKVVRDKGWSYVIQKHAASHLHYDFRLELEGVLKSWAVPKGPSLDPSVKRLAMHVEDHPVDYGDFEGIIPQGEYGGGTVLLWDQGHWEPTGDPREAYRQGKLKFLLHGKKLKGAWNLIKTHSSDTARQNQWLLFKERDSEARSSSKKDILVESPLSVVSGRDLDEIAASKDRVWSSDGKSGRKTQPTPTAADRRTAQQTDLTEKSAPKTSRKKSGTHGTTSTGSRPATRSSRVSGDVPEYDSNSETFAGVRLTHPDKELYPEAGITKLDLAAYYRDIAEWMLPHVLHRPLVLVRCPDGREGECFYQKHPGMGTPAALRQIPIRESKKVEKYVVVDDVDGLISLAQVGALEIHAWGSREDKLEQPDRLVFDLDPNPDVPWKRVVEGAKEIRQFLTDIGLECFLKTTGGKGLHLVVPIARRHDWDEAKAFCKAVADAVVAVAPDRYTSNMSKAQREKKIFLDYLRNGRGATAVVPYSPRSRPGATISMPLAWDELDTEMHSDEFTIQNYQQRMARLRKDPWKRISEVRQSLSNPMKTLRKLGVLN